MGTTMPESFEEMWAALLPIGRSETGGYERRGLGETERQLHDWLADQGVFRGLEVERDATGNTLLWWGGGTDAVLTGSHLDSIPQGGAYDGPLGVSSGIAPHGRWRFDFEGTPDHTGSTRVLQAAGVPAAMLFVRNPTGVSHSPAEHATPQVRLAGVDALATVPRELAG